jgi:methylated-DNA-[protein]-cysteine S-methyltransferase
VNDATRRVVAHLAGHDVDLATIPLALDTVPDFHRRVFEQARHLARGETITYGDLAVRVGSPGGARAVGQAMARNPWPVIVPCHRVLARNGAGGFSAPGALVTKARLLDIEGVSLATAHRPTPRDHQNP